MTHYLLLPLDVRSIAFNRGNGRFIKIISRKQNRFSETLEVIAADATGQYIGNVDKRDILVISGKVSAADKVAILRRRHAQKLALNPSGDIPELKTTKAADTERPEMAQEKPRFSGKSRAVTVRPYSGEREAAAITEQKTRGNRIKTRKQVNDKRPTIIGDDVAIANHQLELARIAGILND